MPTKLKTKPSARLLRTYEYDGFFDEMLGADGKVRPHYSRFRALFQELQRRSSTSSGNLWISRSCDKVSLSTSTVTRQARREFFRSIRAAHNSGKRVGFFGTRSYAAHHGTQSFLHDIYHEQKFSKTG